MKVIKKADFKELLEKSFNSALKKDESTDTIALDSVEVNSIYATVKYSFKAQVHSESSCSQTISRYFKENLAKYMPLNNLDIRLIVADKTFYINTAYTIED